MLIGCIGLLWFFYPVIEMIVDLMGYKQSKLDVYESYINLLLLRRYGKSKGTIN